MNDFEVVTTLRYTTKDNFKGAIVKIKSRSSKWKHHLKQKQKTQRRIHGQDSA